MNFIYLDILQTELWFIPWMFPAGSEVDKRISRRDEANENSWQMGSVRRVEEPLNIYFNENGFATKILLKNLGSTTLYLAILLMSFVLIPILYCMGKLSTR
jgi:hypothetical protein